MKIGERFRKAIDGFQGKSLTLPQGVEIEVDAAGNPVAFFMPISVHGLNVSTHTVNEQIYAYNRCAPVASIINKKVKAHLNRKAYVTDYDGKEQTNATAKAFMTLMGRPNPTQTGKAFEQQAKVYLQLFGECFIFTPRGIPSNPMSVRNMWVIPNWFIKPIYSGKLYQQTELKEIITGYELNVMGSSSQLPLEEVIHIKDIQINTDNSLAGASRLWSLSDQVSAIIAAYEANNELIVNHGAMGLITPNTGTDGIGQSIALTGKEKEQIQHDFARYGVTRGKWKYIITNKSLNFQSMAMPVKDLMLMETIKESVRQIAEAYDMPMMLLGFPEGTTFSNMGEAKKSLYQDAIIPETDDWTAAFTQHFALDKDGMFYRAYFDHLEIFQRSRLNDAQALKAFNEAKAIEFANGILTAEQWRIDIENFTT